MEAGIREPQLSPRPHYQVVFIYVQVLIQICPASKTPNTVRERLYYPVM